jgi:hypothetical protein
MHDLDGRLDHELELVGRPVPAVGEEFAVEVTQGEWPGLPAATVPPQLPVAVNDPRDGGGS